MKKHRKCDTKKYKRHKEAEAVSGKANCLRRSKVESERIDAIRLLQQEIRQESIDLKIARRKLIQVLSNHLCALSPEYTQQMRTRELFSVFGSLLV